MAKIAVGDVSGSASDPHRDPLQWEIRVLLLIAEQFAIPMDLLAAFLEVDRSVAERVVDEFVSREWVREKQFFANDQPWVWLRKAGAEHCGAPIRAKRPAIKLLPHHRAVCEVRLALEEEYPDGAWVCERKILGGRKRREGQCLPDGVFRVPDGDGGSKEWAIEVELTTKLRDEYRTVVPMRCAKYHMVRYYCPPWVAQSLRRVRMFSHSRVRVIGSLKAGRELENFQWKVCSSSRRDCQARDSIDGWEANIVSLLVEQAGIPIDQFARFLQKDIGSAERVADHLEEAGFVWKGIGPVDEGPWLFATLAGAAIAGAGVEPTVPRMLGAERLRHLNEARLTVQEHAPSAVWRSGRTGGRRRQGRRAPAATFESGGREYAVEIEPKAREPKWLLKKYLDLYKQQERQGRGLVVVCAPVNVERLERLKRECDWTDLSVEECEGFRRRSVPKR